MSFEGRGAPCTLAGPGGPGGTRDGLSHSSSGASVAAGCGGAARFSGGGEALDYGAMSSSNHYASSQFRELSSSCRHDMAAHERRVLDHGRCGGGDNIGREASLPKAGHRPDGNPRVAALVRLNGFLLRTHVTSLVSALAEDAWLEGWEKDRICQKARECSQPWASMFLRTYARFVETDDVDSFVAGLRSLIS